MWRRSNFAEMLYPFMIDALRGKEEIRFVVAEPKTVPFMSEGQYRYDFGVPAGLTPMIKMLMLGHQFMLPLYMPAD
ncbi:MAG: hypothetical protein J7L55_04505 [Desulfurococcales archaeon]|nr:hypothetical protein [Desulfurococcales archaeon]